MFMQEIALVATANDDLFRKFAAEFWVQLGIITRRWVPSEPSSNILNINPCVMVIDHSETISITEMVRIAKKSNPKLMIVILTPNELIADGCHVFRKPVDYDYAIERMIEFYKKNV